MKRQILFLLAVFCLMWIQVLPVKADSTEEASNVSVMSTKIT